MTAAHGAEKFYTLVQAEGVSVRSESPEQARALDDKMRECWGRHPNHAVIGNEGKSFQVCVTSLRRVRGMKVFGQLLWCRRVRACLAGRQRAGCEVTRG